MKRQDIQGAIPIDVVVGNRPIESSVTGPASGQPEALEILDCRKRTDGRNGFPT
jgi:hypothetical protein